jgi:hypothetical protein
MDHAIVRAKEQAIRTRADTADLVVLKDRGAFVIRRPDLADLEEVKRFPLPASMMELVTHKVYVLTEVNAMSRERFKQHQSQLGS